MPGVRLKSLKPTEAEIQSQIVQGLRLMGYVVLVTSIRVRKCPHCGKPGAEIKSPTGRLRPEQKELADAGMVFVWRSWDDALATLRELNHGDDLRT